MKKRLLFLLFLCFQSIGAQEKIVQTVEEIEKEVIDYIEKSILTYKINETELKSIKANFLEETTHHGEAFDEEGFESYIEELKRHKLRIAFFQKYPNKEAVYKAPSGFGNKQACSDGGFETGNTNTLYTARRAINPPLSTLTSVDIETTDDTVFPVIPIATTLNSLNAYATLVSPGADPNIPALNRVLNGNRAIRLNVGNNNGVNHGQHVTTLSRSFIINEDTFNYNYSVVMQNPTVEHGNEQQPFFVVRLYDINDNIIR